MTKKDCFYLAIILLLVSAITTTAILSSVPAEEESYFDRKCAAFEMENANYSRGQIVFVGDSITDLYPLDDYYADLSLACYNRGIGGDTTEGVLARIQTSLFDLAPATIVLMIGTNDVGLRRENKDILKNYQSILRQIKEKLPSAKLYCISVIPQGEPLRTMLGADFIDESNRRIIDLNAGIRTLAAEYGGCYLDLHSLLLNEDQLLAEPYSYDGIHLSEAGFVVWTALLKPYLQE